MTKGAHIMDVHGGAKYLILQDVTKQKNIEELLKQKNHELSLVNERLERFSRIVAHDLNDGHELWRSFGLQTANYDRSLRLVASPVAIYLVKAAVRQKAVIRSRSVAVGSVCCQT